MNTDRDLLPAIGKTGTASPPAVPVTPIPATADLATHSLWCAGQLAVEHRSRAFYSRTRRARRAIYGAHPVACGRRDVRMSGADPLAAHEHPVHVTPPSFSLERRPVALAISPSAHVVQADGPVMRFPWELVRSDQTRPGFLLRSARVQFRQEPRRRFCHRFHVKSLPVSLASFDGQMNTKGFPHEAKSEARPGKFTARSGNA